MQDLINSYQGLTRHDTNAATAAATKSGGSEVKGKETEDGQSKGSGGIKSGGDGGLEKEAAAASLSAASLPERYGKRAAADVRTRDGESEENRRTPSLRVTAKKLAELIKKASAVRSVYLYAIFVLYVRTELPIPATPQLSAAYREYPPPCAHKALTWSVETMI